MVLVMGWSSTHHRWCAQRLHFFNDGNKTLSTIDAPRARARSRALTR
jgi:hypothetical protein